MRPFLLAIAAGLWLYARDRDGFHNAVAVAREVNREIDRDRHPGDTATIQEWGGCHLGG